MTPTWAQGRDEIDALLHEGALDQVKGAATDGEALLEIARERFLGAEDLVNGGRCVAVPSNAYDAARLACVALLAQQGLRPTTRGGHRAVVEAMRAQFGASLAPDLDHLRRRRHELEYPHDYADEVTPQEAQECLSRARSILEGATQLLPAIDFFGLD